VTISATRAGATLKVRPGCWGLRGAHRALHGL